MFFTAKIIQDIAEYVAEFGISKAALADQASTSWSAINRPDALISFDQLAKVLLYIRQTQGNPNFGLHLGAFMQLKATLKVDEILHAALDVEEAFEAAVAYSRLISDAMDSHLSKTDEKFRVWFELHPDWAIQSDYVIKQIMDLTLLSVKNALHRLTGKQCIPQAVYFTYPRPNKLTDYYGAFDCRLYFNHDEPAISFARPILKMKIETAHRGLKDQLVRSADETLSQFPMENNFLKVVRRTLLQSMIAQKFHIQDVAQTLNLTTRSLQRKLKMQGTSFKDMQNQLRLQLTGKLYLDQDRSFDEIAYLLGFSENSAFYRAFKQWTDQPPAKYFKSDFS